MLFNKDPNMRYVDMCAEFDNEFYSGQRNDTKLFKYMYLVYYMFACKNNYFKRFEDYDEYAQYAATTVYIRYLRKEKNGERIKSLKNYAESTHYHLKVMWQKEKFNIVNGPEYGAEEAEAMEAYMRNLAESVAISDTTLTDVEELLGTIPSVVSKVLKQSPFKKDKLMAHRLRISCLLTLLSGLTLSKDSINKLKSKQEAGKLDDDTDDKFILKLLKKEKETSIVLWKLDESMTDYVRMLVNKVRCYMTGEVSEIRWDNTASDDVVDAILMNTYKEVYGYEVKEEY